MITTPISRYQVLSPRSALTFLGLACLGLVSVGEIAQAQIVQYTISNGTGTSTSLSATTTDPGVNVSSLTSAGSLTTSGSQITVPGTFTFGTWGAGASPDTTKYIDFSITPTAGNQVAYSTISFAVGARMNVAHGADLWDLQYSLDGFGTAGTQLGSTITVSLAGSGFRGNTTLVNNLDISAIGTQTGTVTFRLFGYDDTSAGSHVAGLVGTGNANLGGGQELTVNGTVSAVPEPSSYAAVFGALAFGFVFITRRLRKA